MVPVASFLTVKIDGQVLGLYSPSDLQSLVSAELAQVPLAVRSFVIDHDDVFTAMITGQYLKYDYHATLVVQTQVDYAQAADVTAIVRHVFFDVTGVLPSSASEVVADANTNEPTTAPASSWTESITGGVSKVGDAIASIVTAVHDDATNLVSGIGGDFKLLLLGLLAIVVVIVLVVGWSPNAPNLVPRL